MPTEKVKSKAKIIPLKPKKKKVVQLSFQECLANEFLLNLDEEKTTILWEAEIKKSFFFLISNTRSLIVTTNYNKGGFQPHDKVTTQDYTLLYIVQIGEFSGELPILLENLIKAGAKIDRILCEYDVNALLQVINGA